MMGKPPTKTTKKTKEVVKVVNEVDEDSEDDEIQKQDLHTLLATLASAGDITKNNTKSTMSSYIKRLSGELLALMKEVEKLKTKLVDDNNSGLGDLEQDDLTEEDESVRAQTKSMYERNKDFKILKDDIVRDIRKTNSLHYQRFEKKITNVQTKCDQNLEEQINKLKESFDKRLGVVEKQLNNVRKTTTVLKDRMPSEREKELAENAPKEVFLHKLEGLVTINEEQRQSVTDIAAEVLSNLECFNLFDKSRIVSAKQIGNRGVDPDKVELKDLKILVELDDTELRDQIIRESSQTSATKNSIRPGKTPEEIKKGRMFYNCWKLCQTKNGQLSGDQEETRVWYPVYQPGSEHMFTPKLRDPTTIQKNQQQYRERMAQKQTLTN